MIPNQPEMLLSFVNTKLRDFYPDLETMCQELDIDPQEIREKLKLIDYEYDESLNRFV